MFRGSNAWGPYTGASIRVHDAGVETLLAMTCHTDRLELSVSFQASGVRFDHASGEASVSYRFGSRSAAVSERWFLAPFDGILELVYPDASQEQRFAASLRADTSDSLRVELGTLDGGTSAELDITGADEAAGPVLGACGA